MTTLNRDSFDRDGFLIAGPLIDEVERKRLIDVVKAVVDPAQPHAVRHLLRVPAIRALARDRRLVSLVQTLAGEVLVCVRGILFDKTSDANWKVTWHQDRTVALIARRESAHFGPWSTKDGIVHADASADILGRMVTVRLHLDACDDTNGPLRVIPGSHAYGKLTDPQIQDFRQQHKEVVCHVERGAALVMRPLLLHASAKAERPAHRRVVHLEYGPRDLPDGCDWHDAV